MVNIRTTKTYSGSPSPYIRDGHVHRPHGYRDHVPHETHYDFCGHDGYSLPDYDDCDFPPGQNVALFCDDPFYHSLVLYLTPAGYDRQLNDSKY